MFWWSGYSTASMGPSGSVIYSGMRAIKGGLGDNDDDVDDLASLE